MKLSALAPALCSTYLLACGGGDDGVTPPQPDAGVIVPPGCIQPDVRDRTTVTVSGQVVDFTTGAPVAGATVDVTTAWDVVGNFPAADCPLLATLTTDAAGRFGPRAVAAGSTVTPPILAFVVHDGGRALTLSDARTCAAATCDLGHTIAAPSAAQAAQWRADLGTGGMAAAATRGLVAFTYKNSDGSPAAGVAPSVGNLVTVPLTPGPQVRFVDPARAALLPAAQATTSAAGVALIGVDATAGAAYLGGKRGAEAWAGVGCLVVPGAIFVEDKTVSPPP